MIWKYIFNGGLTYHGIITKAAALARQGGYEFLAWNGRIYFLADDNILETKWTVETIEGKEK